MTAMRQIKTISHGPANGSNRPFADLLETRRHPHVIAVGPFEQYPKCHPPELRVSADVDAEKRVSDVVEQAKNAKNKAIDAAKTAAEAARKAGVYVALWAFISLLIGAFSASYMATVGGRVRDDLPMAG